MIEAYRIQNFGCIRDIQGCLTPLHAFIGPNDSGKSTLLRALHYTFGIANWRSGYGLVRHDPRWAGYLKQAQHSTSIEVQLGDSAQFLVVDANGRLDYHSNGRTISVAEQLNNPQDGLAIRVPENAELRPGADKMLGVRFLRLDPDALKARSQLITDGDPVAFSEGSERGEGLPGVLDAILNRGDDSFNKMKVCALQLFPILSGIRLKNVSTSHKELEFELKDGRRIPASSASEGLLYYLAFSSLLHSEPVSLILVEEPENGLHPARIRHVVRTLREVSENGCQVVLATHSPLVINELEPDEVSVLVREEATGTQVHPLSETPHFDERSKVYALGELWLSYADGDFEAPLLNGENQEP